MSSAYDQNSEQRITELETRIVFLEDTIDTMNTELSNLSADFRMAREALQLLYKKLEQFQSGSSGIRNVDEETPPPHY